MIKYLYNPIKSFKNNLFLKCTLLFFASFLLRDTAHAEGSGDWGVTADRQINIMAAATSSNGTGNTGYINRGFMLLPSSTSSYNPEHRLLVWVKPGETVYWGFRGKASANVTFSWYYDSGSTEFYPTATTNGNGRVLIQAETFNAGTSGGAQGRPANAAAAAAGPSQLGNSGGYNAFSFTNNTGVARAYWLETSVANAEYNFWDITVADDGNERPGRVYCKFWNTVNELPNSLGNPRTDGKSYPNDFGFYIPIENTYTNEGYYVKQMKLPGSSGGYTVFFANPEGPRNHLDFTQNRRSINASSTNSYYPLFLNNPDPTVWESAPLPIANFEADFFKFSDNPPQGNARFTVTIDNPSIVDIMVDLNNDGVFDADIDIVLSNEFEIPGTYEIFWDGLGPDLQPVPSGTHLRFIASVLFYPVHFPIYDMEQSLGLQIYHVRPGNFVEDKQYWDDFGITYNGTPANSRRSVVTNLTGSIGAGGSGTFEQYRHTWWANGDNGWSQNNTINTWTGGFNEEIAREMVFNYAQDVDLSITKIVSSHVGDEVTFTLAASHLTIVPTNPNQTAASGVFVEDKLPAGYTFISYAASKGSYNSTNGVWTIGDLAIGATETLTITATANAAGPYLNKAEIDGHENDVNPNNNKDEAIIGFSISGNVFNDNNGTEELANGNPVDGTTLGLIVNLYDESGNYITSTTVNASGSYIFENIQPGVNYQLQLSNYPGNTNPGGLAQNPSTLPPSYTNVSSYDDVTPTNGINMITVSGANSAVSGINFGINEPPTAVDDVLPQQENPGGELTIDITNTFSGYDENNGIIVSLTITEFPDNATSITIGSTTYYPSFNDIPSGCSGCAVFPTGGVTVPTDTIGQPTAGNEIAVDPIDGNATIYVSFLVTDNAGLQSGEAEIQVPLTTTNTNNTTYAFNDKNIAWKNNPASGDVTTNDFDLEGHTQSFVSFVDEKGDPIPSGSIVSGVDKDGNPVLDAGTLTFGPNGEYTFTPNADFVGNVSVPYTICDDGSPVACATAYLDITVIEFIPQNNTVIANNDVYLTYGSPIIGDITVNDADPQGNLFTVTAYTYDNIGDGIPNTPGAINTPMQIGGKDNEGNSVINAGTITIEADGTFVFIPSPGFEGNVYLNYTITDDQANAATDNATIVITVITDKNGVLNDPPFAGDDFAYTYLNTPVEGSFIHNDFDPNNDPISISGTTIVPGGPKNPITTVTTKEGGSIEFFSDGTYIYTPLTGYRGTDKVVYEICDVTTIAPQPLCAEATIYLLVGRNTVLPVNLVSFTATVNSCEVMLHWVTATEVNNEYYQVQRSFDARTWENIDKISGRGNAVGLTTYQSTDNIGGRDLAYYRLIQVDFDGAKTYHKTVAVKGQHCDDQKIAIYPNPAKNVLNVEMGNQRFDDVRFTIIDANGNVIKTIRSGGQINIHDIPNGNYFLQISTNNIQKEALPFVIIR